MSGEIIASIVSIVISAVIGPICVLLVTSKLKRNEESQKRLEEERKNSEQRISESLRRERREEITAIVSKVIEEKTEPISGDVKRLNEKLDKVSDGTLSTLRNDITKCYYNCVEKGYRNDYDYQNVHHMYDSYKELNGNSYISDVVDRFDKLPTKEEFGTFKKKSSRTKKTLVENKK